jgi:polysaccharide pyruvyl transferase WcaK-like protein
MSELSTAAAAGESPRRIYLVATAGFPNYGDELITAHWLRQLAERAPDADVWVDCPSPGLAAVLLDGLHPRARFVDTLFRLCWEAPSESPWEVAAFAQQAVDDPGRAPRWAEGVELLRGADVVHLLGGGYLHGEWPRHVGLVAGAVAAIRHSGGRAVATGLGLAPVAEGVAPLLCGLADRFEVVDLRDEASGAVLRAGGVGHARVSCDDAWLGLGPGTSGVPTNSSPDLPEFMLCAQSDMLTVDRSRLAGLILETLRAWRVAPENLGVVEGIPGVDREIYALIEHHIPGARFFPFAHIWRDGLPVAPGQTWLSTRFHPHLMAAAAGASGVAIPVSPDYYLTKHESLIAQGSRWGVAKELTVPDLPTAGGFPAEVVRRQHTAKAELADAVYGPASRGSGATARRGPAPANDAATARNRLWDRRRRDG